MRAESKVRGGLGFHRPPPGATTPTRRLASSFFSSSSPVTSARSVQGQNFEVERFSIGHLQDLCRPKGDQLSTDFIYREVFEGESCCYLRHGIDIGEGDIVVDVGANVGFFALYCAERVGESGAVLCYEPAPCSFQCLTTNVSPYSQITPYNVAISNCEGEAELTTYARASGWNTLSPSPASIQSDVSSFAGNLKDEQIFAGSRFLPSALKRKMGKILASMLTQSSEKTPCRANTLSKAIRLQGSPLIEENPKADIALLKIDVERHEHEVLQGIAEEDWTRIKQIVAEVHDGFGQGLLDRFVTILKGHNYDVVVEQEPELIGSDLYNIFAKKKSTLGI